MSNNSSVVSVKEATELEGCKSVLLLTASTFAKWREKDEVYTFEKETLNKYTFEGLDVEIEGFYQLEPVPKLLVRQGNTPDLIIVMASALARKSVKVQYLNETFEISPVDFLIKRLKEEEGFDDTKFCIIDTENRLNGAISDAVYILRKIRDNSNECKYYLDTHGGIRQDQENFNAITNLLELENIEFVDIFNISGENKPIDSIKNSRTYDFTAGIKEFVNFGRSKSLDGYLENNNSNDSKIHEIIRGISDALTLCNIEEFEAGLDALNNELGPVPEEYVPAESYMEIFTDTIRNSYKGLLDPEERNLVAELQWAINHGFIQQALALVESKSARFFVQNVIMIEEKKNNINKNIISTEEFIEMTAEYYEEETNALFAPVVFKEENVNVTQNAIIVNGHTSKKNKNKKFDLEYPIDKVFSDEKELIKETTTYWHALKKIRNHVMHSNGMKANNATECKLFRKVTKGESQMLYASDCFGAYKEREITEAIFKNNKDLVPDISMKQITYILESYLECLKKIRSITSQNRITNKDSIDKKINSVIIKMVPNEKKESNKSTHRGTVKGKKTEYKIISDILEAQITKFTHKGNTSVKLINPPAGVALGGCNEAQNKDGHIEGKLCEEPYNKKLNDIIRVKMTKNEAGLTTFEMID